MTYTFRILFNEEEDFLLELKIGSTKNFLELNSYLQMVLKFDKRQMTSFYLTNNEWEKELEITLMDIDDDLGILNMENCILGDYLAKTGDRLLYIFDFFEERALNLELIVIDETDEETDAEILKLEGKAPEQNQLPEINPDLSFEDLKDDDTYDDEISFESIDDLDI